MIVVGVLIGGLFWYEDKIEVCYLKCGVVYVGMLKILVFLFCSVDVVLFILLVNVGVCFDIGFVLEGVLFIYLVFIEVIECGVDYVCYICCLV